MSLWLGQEMEQMVLPTSAISYRRQHFSLVFLPTLLITREFLFLEFPMDIVIAHIRYKLLYFRIYH